MSDRVRREREAQGKWTVHRLADDREDGRTGMVRSACCNNRPVHPRECVRVTPDLRAVLERVRSNYPWVERDIGVDFDADYLCSACIRQLHRAWRSLGRKAILDAASYRAAIGAPADVVEKGREAVAKRAHRARDVLSETREVLQQRLGYEHRWPKG